MTKNKSVILMYHKGWGYKRFGNYSWDLILSLAELITDEIRDNASRYIDILKSPNESGLGGNSLGFEKHEGYAYIVSEFDDSDDLTDNYKIPINQLIYLIEEWKELRSRKCPQIILRCEYGRHSFIGQDEIINYILIDKTTIITKKNKASDYELDEWGPKRPLESLLIDNLQSKNRNRDCIDFLKNPEETLLINNGLKIEKRNHLARIRGEYDKYEYEVFKIPIDKLLDIIETWNKLRIFQYQTIILKQENGLITLTKGE